MEKSTIRKFALNLAFFQLFSCAAAKSESKLVLVDDTNKNNPIYERYDTDTKKYSKISIFDEINARSHQYGACQNVFESHFNRLIDDPLIWDEMQKIFPWKSIGNKEYALLFYKFYFNIFSDDGCGYAALTSYIFRLFEGREKEFYDTFGFSMYDVDTDIKFVDFNYEIIMLKFFNYYIKSNNATEDIKNATMRKVYEYKLEEYKDKKKNHRKAFSEFKNWTPEEFHKWKDINDLYKSKIDELTKKLKSIPENDRRYGLPLEDSLGSLTKFLAKYGIKTKPSITDGSKGTKADDILAVEDYILTEQKESYDYKETGQHYLYVVDKEKDGEIVVASWGSKHIFEDKPNSWVKRLRINSNIIKH